MAHDLEPVFNGTTGWRRIYLDLPGRGGSPSAFPVVSAGDLLALILHFVDAVIGQGRLSVIGASYGGLFARAIAHQTPDRLDGLCLISPHLRVSGPTSLPERTVVVPGQVDQTALPDGWEWIPDMLVVQTPQVAGALTANVQAMKAQPDMDYLDLTGAPENEQSRSTWTESPPDARHPPFVWSAAKTASSATRTGGT